MPNGATNNHYNNNRKYRALLSMFFDALPEYLARLELLSNTPEAPDKFMSRYRSACDKTDTAQLRERAEESLNFAFNNPAKVGPGRWNRAGQPAIYTAREPETAIKELCYHLSLECQRAGNLTPTFQITTFEVFFSGSLRDVRSCSSAQQVIYRDPCHGFNYAATQQIADSIRLRESVCGIAYYSARCDQGGCCCVIWQRDCLTAGNKIDFRTINCKLGMPVPVQPAPAL